MEKVQREKWVYQSIYTSIEKEQEYALSGKQLVDLVQFENYLILDTLLASVYWKDLEGKILGCNRYVLDMFGYQNRADFIGKKNEEFLPAKIATKVSEHDQKVITSGKVLVIEEQAKMVHFEKIQTFITTKTPLIDKEGKIIGLIGVSINITEQKEAEEKLREEEKKSLRIKQKELEEREQRVIAEENHWAAALAMSSLAHDLKNHLQPLGFAMELIENLSLEDPKAAEKMQKYLQIHQDNLQKTYFFIDQINQQQQSRLKGEKYVFSKYLIAAVIDYLYNTKKLAVPNQSFMSLQFEEKEGQTLAITQMV